MPADFASVKTLADKLEELLSERHNDVEAAEKLSERLKAELLQLSGKPNQQVLDQINRLKTEYSELQQQFLIARKRKRREKLKADISNLEARLARLEFQLIPKSPPELEITKRRASRLESELNRLKNDRYRITPAMLNWEIFPPGEHLSTAVKRFYVDSFSKSNSNEKIEFERLYQIIEAFKPLQCFMGKNEFDGYLVFLLNGTKKVICDNPVVGNAIYILNGDWQTLSQQSKSELLNLEKEHVRRVIHKGDWIVRIKQAILA